MANDAPGWRFFDYCDRSGQSVIEEWLATVSPVARELFLAKIRDVRKISDHKQWGLTPLRALQMPIFKIEVKADRREYRVPLVFRAGQRRQCVLLVGYYHKGPVCTPADALTTAGRRAEEVQSGQASLKERREADNEG